MLSKIKSEKLIAIMILIFWIMQFVLTMTGHQKIDQNIMRLQAVSTPGCISEQVTSP